MNLKPGSKIVPAVNALGPNEPLVLQAGAEYQGGWIYQVPQGFSIEGNGAKVIAPKGLPGLKIGPSVGPVKLQDLDLSDSDSHGLFAVICKSLTGLRLTCSRNAGSGVLTANISDVALSGLLNEGNSQHGCYLSQSGDRLAVLDSRFNGNALSGVQVNAVEGVGPRNRTDPLDDWLSHHVRVSGCVFSGNQGGKNGGAAAIQFAGVRRGWITKNRVSGHLGRWLIACFDDEEGAIFGCHDIEVDECLGRFAVTSQHPPQGSVFLGPGSERIVVGKANDFPREVPQVVR